MPEHRRRHGVEFNDLREVFAELNNRVNENLYAVTNFFFLPFATGTTETLALYFFTARMTAILS